MSALFDLPLAPPAELTMSADRRRTARQARALANGQHPLALALGHPLGLHQDAAPADDRRADGRRCGTCRFRQNLSYKGRAFYKCVREGMPITHGPGTDCRAWWPACIHHEPAEQEDGHG